MNDVTLMGRITKDIEVRYTTSNNPKAVVNFTLALDRGKDKNGNSLGADFPNIIAWEKTAESIGKWFSKGDGILIEGHLKTGSYEKDGHKVYTTDVVCDKWEFPIGRANKENVRAIPERTERYEVPDGFEMIDEGDVPF